MKSLSKLRQEWKDAGRPLTNSEYVNRLYSLPGDSQEMIDHMLEVLSEKD